MLCCYLATSHLQAHVIQQEVLINIFDRNEFSILFTSYLRS